MGIVGGAEEDPGRPGLGIGDGLILRRGALQDEAKPPFLRRNDEPAIGRKQPAAIGVGIHQHGLPDLLHLPAAGDAQRLHARAAQGREQQRDQDRDDADHHQ